MAALISSRSEKVMASIEGGDHRMLTESLSPLQSELRKKQFRQDHAEWFALQNKVLEEHSLWCDGLVPWANESFDGFRVD